jgi:hypothetical protein
MLYKLKISNALVATEYSGRSTQRSTQDTHSHLYTRKLSEGYPFPPGEEQIATVKNVSRCLCINENL